MQSDNLVKQITQLGIRYQYQVVADYNNLLSYVNISIKLTAATGVSRYSAV